ncbi:MerR family transcriptional regulator [Pseudonocardia sp. MH-G8]|uniref:MerR family transcriptional regulator n=1 Tax=Pseudonocardia sp. MH-G8 TaxID=1854588 RepID=UPI001E363CF0|nr:MerR family transcriptional regulator [Pseudonocardia sp. MH-G8]
MAELSSRTGVPIPTIKFYLREGLLPSGERTSPNQAQYGEEHARRLKLIRALVDVGGLSIVATSTVLGHLDAVEMGTLDQLGKVQYALTQRREREPEHDEAWRAAQAQVDELLERRGWSLRGDNPARTSLVEALSTLHRLGQHDVLDLLDRYADAAEHLASAEVTAMWERPSIEDRAEGVVTFAVLADALLAALRRLAQEAEVVHTATSA